MAAYVWAAASAGNWSVGANWKVGGVVQSVPPTSSDSVAFGAGSGFTQSNCTLDTTGNCSTITFAGYTGTFNYSSQTLNISGTTATFVVGMTLSGNGTSALVLSGSSVLFTGAGKSFPGTTSFTGSGQASISGANTFVNLTRTGTAVRTDSVAFSSDQTISGILTLAGNSAINRLLVQGGILGTARTLTVNTTVTASYVDIQDITGAGSASWALGSITGNSGDCQGNSGITFTTPATQTFISPGTKNWSDVTVWTSRIPLPQDDVVINTTTTTTLTVDMPRMCHSIDYTGFTRTQAHSGTSTGGTATMYGNVTLASGMTITNSGQNNIILAGRGSQTYKSNGITYPVGANGNSFSIAAPGGTYTLQDNCTFSNGSINTGFILVAGTLDMNNFTLSVTYFLSNSTTNARTLTTHGVAITCTGSGATNVVNINSTNLTFTTAPSFTLTGVSASTKTFIGGGMTYGALTHTVSGSTGSLVITGANTFSAINFSDASNARTLTLPASTTTTIQTAAGVNINGTSGALMTIASSSGTLAATLAVSSGVVSCDYLTVTRITASTSTPFYAGTHSTDGSGNTNWLFSAPALLASGQFFAMLR